MSVKYLNMNLGRTEIILKIEPHVCGDGFPFVEVRSVSHRIQHKFAVKSVLSFTYVYVF